ARLREIAGVAFLALTVAALIALASFNARDPSLNVATGSGATHNYLGVLGAYFADVLVQLFGFGAWLFPAFCFGSAVLLFAGIAISPLSRLGRAAGLTGFSLALVALGNLAFGARNDPFYPPTDAGGALGATLAGLARPWLGDAGAALAFAFLLVASFTLATHLTPRRIAAGAWSGARGAGGTAGAVWDALRHAWELRRGRKEKERARQRREAAQQEPGGADEVPDDLPEPALEIDEEELEGPLIVHRPPPRRAAAPRKTEPARKAGAYVLPPLSLLDDPPADRVVVSEEEVRANSRTLERKLADFGANGRVTQVHPGPVITTYDFEPAAGVKMSRIEGLQDDLALALSAVSIRVARSPGKSVVGIELPNKKREAVTLKELMLSEEFAGAHGKLAVALGKSTLGTPRVGDLGKMPHVLIAGATGSGKSVMINTLISSILFSARPDEVQFIMIDPKMVELTMYDGIPHLIAPVVSNPKKAAYALRNAVGLMEERYRILAERKVRNIESYNHHLAAEAKARGEAPALMSYLVIVIDELADLMILAQSEVEDSITRLAQLSRAVGMHLVIATQRPSTNVITGIIKANLPVRMSFNVSSKIDSRVVLDANGAEQLLGKGDMLYLPPGSNRLERIHGAFVSEDEVKRLVGHLKGQAQPTYDEALLLPPPADAGEEAGGDGEQDEMYDQAVAVVSESGQASISYVQRRLKVGYNRAARMIEAMEKAGLVSPADGAKPRRILARRSYDED
ncbi:MAG TPA: DNA translocase FtsK, partial [Candidatus Methanoperedens sp.]|nr:DNA translocase FtsK [Candidatus Methanoperedens sp.]